MPEPSPAAAPQPSTQPEVVGRDWWTAERAALYRWLERKAPVLAPVYEAAAHMALDESFPGRVWFVAHAIRDIRNRLPDALGGEIAAARTEYADLAAAVHARWIEDGFPPDGVPSLDADHEPSASNPGRREIFAELLKAVAALVSGHVAASENNEAKVRRLFEAVSGAPAPTYVVKAWIRGTRWANSFAHVRNKPLLPRDEESLVANFVAFEQALMAISKRSFENMDALDEILGAANR